MHAVVVSRVFTVPLPSVLPIVVVVFRHMFGFLYFLGIFANFGIPLEIHRRLEKKHT